MTISRTVLLVVLSSVTAMSGTVLAENKVGPWDLDVLFQAPAWEETELAPKPGMTGILYSSLPHKGEPVQVFAYYSAPAGDAPAGGWPAMVCAHGGGGTAFDQWVKLWNDHGYAAISMDLEGHLPLKAESGKGRKATPNPGPHRKGQFANYDKPLDQQWYYHAVAQIILANSLLRSFPEVNVEKIGLTGISWGGNLTSSVMGIDTRFKCAIPVFGCGFLSDSDGYMGRAITEGKHAEVVDTHYDGSAYFGNVDYPTFWVNGTNDFHFSMPATQESSRAVKGPATLRFKLKMGHGHNFRVEEVYAFADGVLKGKTPLLALGRPMAEGDTAAVDCKTPERIKSAQLLYTTDADSIWPDKEWHTAEAEVDGVGVSGKLPPGTFAFYFEVTDTRDLMVGSEFLVHEVAGAETAAEPDSAGDIDFDGLFKQASAPGNGIRLILADNFEAEEIGKDVSGILDVKDPAGKAGIIQWYDEVASGGKALKITNSATVEHAYQPCLSQWLRGGDVVRKGTLEISFDVLIPTEGGNPMSVLVRDYTTKPPPELMTLICTHQGVRLNGRSLRVGTGQWVHYTVELPVGVPNGKITLIIVDRTSGSRTVEQPINGGTAKAVSWVGFCLGGKVDGAMYLDNLVVKVLGANEL